MSDIKKFAERTELQQKSCFLLYNTWSGKKKKTQRYLLVRKKETNDFEVKTRVLRWCSKVTLKRLDDFMISKTILL